MIQFADAVKAVDSWLRQEWRGTPGTPYVSTEGYQDDDDFLVVCGAREWLVDEDPGFLLVDNSTVFVSRETGEVREEPTTTVLAKIKRMSPVTVTD